jgi:DNA-binding LacI/PurR family transcriptional regulator
MRRPTIADVARLADVSIATVSRVVNGTGTVTPATRSKVEQAIAALGYRPNHLARSLPARAVDQVIGLMIPEISNPVFPRLAESIAHEARELGYQVMLCQTDNDPDVEASSTVLLIDRRVAGIIFVSGQFSLVEGRLDAYEMCRQAEVPYVLVNAETPRLDAPAVATDEVAAGWMQANYLRQYGHARLAFIGGPLDYWVTRDRLRGILSRLEPDLAQGRVSYRPVLAGFSYQAAREAARELLQGENAPTGIMCASDLIAMAVLHVAWDLGVAVPRDVSVIGFDGVEAGVVTGPPLTTVAQPLEAMGREAVYAVVHRTPGRVLTPTLVERASVAPPRSSADRGDVPAGASG